MDEGRVDLYQESKAWVKEGLVTAEQAAALRKRHAALPPAGLQRLHPLALNAIAALVGVMAGAGLIALLETVNPGPIGLPGRIAIAVAAVAAVTAPWTAFRHAHAALREAAHVAGAVLCLLAPMISGTEAAYLQAIAVTGPLLVFALPSHAWTRVVLTLTALLPLGALITRVDSAVAQVLFLAVVPGIMLLLHRLLPNSGFSRRVLLVMTGIVSAFGLAGAMYALTQGAGLSAWAALLVFASYLVGVTFVWTGRKLVVGPPAAA